MDSLLSFNQIFTVLLCDYFFVCDFCLLHFLQHFLLRSDFFMTNDPTPPLLQTSTLLCHWWETSHRFNWGHFYVFSLYKLSERRAQFQCFSHLFEVLLFFAAFAMFAGNFAFEEMGRVCQRAHLVFGLAQFFDHLELQTFWFLLGAELHLGPVFEPLAHFDLFWGRWIVPLQVDLDWLEEQLFCSLFSWDFGGILF